MLHIAGAGMAGLCAAARARELGLDVAVFEKGNRPGGSMLLSSCVVWRYLDADAFHEECPHGDRALQAQVVERLDDGLVWLRGLGAEVVWEETGNPRTAGMGEFYGRAMPAPPAAIPEDRFVDLAQLYGRYALVLDDGGREFAPEQISWSETDLVQAIARRPNAQAWYVVDEDTLAVELRGRTVREMVEAARGAGADVLLPNELGIDLPGSYRYAVHVVAGITHTIGGARIDERARVLAADGSVVEGLYAAGADAGGIAAGGYASGLASALVFGRLAAETAASV